VRSRPIIGFALGAATAALLGAVGLLWWSAAAGASAAPWAVCGFAAMALPGILGGAWLAREHGRPGSRFLSALATGFVTRLVLVAVAAFYAAKAGEGAGTALLAGLAAGFVPLMIFEMVWFLRARGTRQVGTETRG
jgi:hypothetical protein